MFIPYRIIQLKQKSHKQPKSIQPTTQLNTNQLFEHCNTKPIQKFQPFDYEQNKQFHINTQVLKRNKNGRKLSKGMQLAKTFLTKDEWRLDGRDGSKNRKKIKSKQKYNLPNGYSDHKKRHIDEEKSKNQQTIQQSAKKNLITISMELEKRSKPSTSILINSRRYRSIDDDRISKKQKSTDPLTQFLHNSANAAIETSNNENINKRQMNKSLSLSKSITKSKMFDIYMQQIHKKHSQKIIKRRRLSSGQSILRITGYNNNHNFTASKQLKKMEDMYKNRNNKQKIQVAGRSINTSKIINYMEIQIGNKFEHRIENRTEKIDRKMVKYQSPISKDEESEIKGWKYSKLDNFGIQQII